MNQTVPTKPAGPQIDLETIREKYRRERDRRVRPDGEQQYVEVSGKYAKYGEHDPYAPAHVAREPLCDEVEVLIVGGGWAGLMAGAQLRGAGLNDIRILEAGADFGGTWYWNRYPGAQCDIESYCYMPLLEETGYIPKEKYSYAPELFQHAQRIGRMFGLYDVAYFQTRVSELRWDEGEARWRVRTNRGDEIRARFVINATGPASRPKLPGIPGLDDFKGKTFHTSRWDYEYTGGDHSGNLHKLADKRVAIIGTGATAIQCVPYLGAAAKHLYVIQRTPSSVDFRGNRPTDPEWAKSLKPGWQRERQQNFDDIVLGRPFEVDLVNDAWTDIFRNLQNVFVGGAKSSAAPSDNPDLPEIVDAQKMEQIRARVEAEVKDPHLAELLKPWYRQFCKRPTFNDEYLATFNRANVTLVDTSDCHGVERITPKGLIANGVEYEVDCIIFATGFEISTSWHRRIGFPIYGRAGESLYDHWAKGLRTLHGYGVHGFPNWFLVGASQNGVSVNYSGMVSEQARHVAFLINAAKQRGATRIEPTAEAEAEWVAEIRRLSGAARAFLQACTPGYYNNEGQLETVTATFGGDAYAPGANAFNALLDEWRRVGDFKGITFS